jgi:hypothetical protein
VRRAFSGSLVNHGAEAAAYAGDLGQRLKAAGGKVGALTVSLGESPWEWHSLTRRQESGGGAVTRSFLAAAELDDVGEQAKLQTRA